MGELGMYLTWQLICGESVTIEPVNPRNGVVEFQFWELVQRMNWERILVALSIRYMFRHDDMDLLQRSTILEKIP